MQYAEIHALPYQYMVRLQITARGSHPTRKAISPGTRSHFTRHAKPFHPAREDILLIMKNNIFRKNMLIW